MLSLLPQIAAVCSSALSPAHATPDGYLVGVGDMLHVEVYGESFGGDFVVGPTGTIRFPYCDVVEVGNETVFAVEAALRDCLSDGYLNNPQISVRIGEYRSQRIEVLGAVGKPGVYFLEGETTLRSVIGQAGGVQADKTTGRVVVSRGAERIVVLLEEVEGPKGGLSLSRGDVISVEEGAVVYVGGEVENPGAIGYIDGLTVTQALMKAGGPTGLARLRGAFLLREGEPRMSVNIRRMLRGKDADFLMKPGDKLVVQESPI